MDDDFLTLDAPVPNPDPQETAPSTEPTLAPSHFLKGNFFPSLNECYHNVSVRFGKIPQDLAGMFCRVGPNPRFDTSGKPYHPFDGDGKIHSVTFNASSEAFYERRWVRTKRFQRASEVGFDTFPFGAISKGQFQYMSYNVDENGESMGPANTAVLAFSNKTYALYESDKPYEVVTSLNPKENLKTVGRESFNNTLRHPVAAHPKVDMKTNEFILFGYNIVSNPPVVSYSVVDRHGVIKTSCDIPLDAPKMMHDMVITNEYSILFDPNYNFERTKAMQGKSPWVHRKDVPAHFCVFPRHLTNANQAKWVEVTPCGLFHFANAWQEGQLIKIYGCRSDSMQVDEFSQLPATHMHEWIIDTMSWKCISERPLSTHVCDFPQVDATRQGYKTRYLYAVEYQKCEGDSGTMPYFTAVLKFDLVKDEVIRHAAKAMNGNIHRISEAAFGPSTKRGEGAGEEDKGYIMYYAHDEEENVSECTVLDARSMQVVARLSVPERIPYGFHASFVHPENFTLSKL